MCYIWPCDSVKVEMTPLLEVANEVELHCRQVLSRSGTGDTFESQESWDAALQVPELAGFNAKVNKNFPADGGVNGLD